MALAGSRPRATWLHVAVKRLLYRRVSPRCAPGSLSRPRGRRAAADAFAAAAAATAGHGGAAAAATTTGAAAGVAAAWHRVGEALQRARPVLALVSDVLLWTDTAGRAWYFNGRLQGTADVVVAVVCAALWIARRPGRWPRDEAAALCAMAAVDGLARAVLGARPAPRTVQLPPGASRRRRPRPGAGAALLACVCGGCVGKAPGFVI